MTILIVVLIAAFFGLYAYAAHFNSKPQPKMSWKMTDSNTVTPPQK